MFDSKNAHSSHFTNTSNAFWVDVMVAETNAHFATGSPHGNATFADADIIAVAESWAEHLARSFADLKYGTNVSISSYSSYKRWLEHQRNEKTNHIPIGLYHDLIDGINTTEQAGDGYWGNYNIGTVNDNVIGLSNAQLFNLLNTSTTSPSSFIQKVKTSGIIQSPNTTNDVDNLFNSY
jgi:hypothetical protein